MVQFVGVPCAFAFGVLAGRLSAQASIFLALAVYVIITLAAFSIRTTGEFFLICFLVGTVMGGVQTLFASMIPRHKAAEMFGLFGSFDRFGGAIGSSILGFVVLDRLPPAGHPGPRRLPRHGGPLLSRVDVARG